MTAKWIYSLCTSIVIANKLDKCPNIKNTFVLTVFVQDKASEQVYPHKVTDGTVLFGKEE